MINYRAYEATPSFLHLIELTSFNKLLYQSKCVNLTNFFLNLIFYIEYFCDFS